MPDQRRASRADRRRTNSAPPGAERRGPPTTTFTAYSQSTGDELQVYAQTVLTADNCAAARDVLMRHCTRVKAPTVVLDLMKATFIDTIGLSLVFEIKREMEAQGRTFLLQNPSRCVLRMLNLTRTIRVFSIRVTHQDLERIPHAGKTPPKGLEKPQQQQG
jgi:anti-anti-sigma factor